MTRNERRDGAHDSRVVDAGLGTRIRQTGGEIITPTAACQVAGRPYGGLGSFVPKRFNECVSSRLNEIDRNSRDTHASLAGLLIGRPDEKDVVVLFFQLVVNSPDVGGSEPIVVGQHDVEVCLNGDGRQSQAGE